MALEELGVFEEAIGQPPEINASVRIIFDAYWEMRVLSTLDEALELPSVVAWLDAHQMGDSLSDWLPYFAAMESERRVWLAEEMKRRRDQSRTHHDGLPEAY